MLSSCRNGHAVACLHHIITTKGTRMFLQDIMKNIQLAEYLVVELKRRNIPAWRNEYSTTVVLPAVNLSEQIIYQNSIFRHEGLCHIIVNLHVTKDVIEDFLTDVDDNKDANGMDLNRSKC